MSDDVRYVRCPRHESEEPSLAIDLETGRYHCDLCGASGMLTPHGEEQLLMERRGQNPVLPEALAALKQIGPAEQFI